MGFPGGSAGEESACSAGDLGSVPGSGRSAGEGNGNRLQHSCLKNPMDREAWQAIVHRVTRVRHDLATKPPPSIQGLPWWLRGQSVCLQCGRAGFDSWVGKIPWRRNWQPTLVLLPGKSHGRRKKPGGRQSMGLHRVGHD